MKKLCFLEPLLAIILVIILCMGAHADAQQAALSSKLMRLHVIANSDSKEDQALKLKVRDRVLEFSQELLLDAKNSHDAQKILSQNLDNIKDCAQQAIYDNGFSYPARVQLTPMYFPTREYSTFALPAGRYDAFRIIIGDGLGKNWWCVMFPPMCIDASGAYVAERARDAGLTDEELEVISRGEDVYRYEFKIMELVGKLKHLFGTGEV